MPSRHAVHWSLDPDVLFLNHGSFGACPLAVLEAQAELRRRMEREPVRFFTRTLGPLWDAARARLAAFVGADPAGLAFVPNATTGVNTVLASLPLEAGDQILVTDHGYRACTNAADRWASRAGAEVVTARIPFPCDGPGEVVEAVLDAVTARTRLALIDHVASPTGLVLPVERLVPALRERGVQVLVDGAHALGMLELKLDALGADYYTANAHKWLCAPKGSAFLWARQDRRAGLTPLVTSHGRTLSSPDRARFLLEFDWTGTDDPTPHLTVPAALDFMGSLLPGGWPKLRQTLRDLARGARRTVAGRLGLETPCPLTMMGALATLELPPPVEEAPPRPDGQDPLHPQLAAAGVQAPVFAWPAPGRRWIRMSAQLYNAPEDYERLAAALAGLLGERTEVE